jgi:ATP-dependent exoDNAse (exonuclease V) beta subunit
VPSASQLGWPELEAVVAKATLGTAERLPTAIRLDGKGIDHEVLGNAVHAFFAADVENLTEADRLERAARLLAGVGMTGVVRAESLVTAGDTLRNWVNGKWPDAVWRREVPIDAMVESAHGERRVSGIIDLLLETSDGCVIVDHKTFPGTTEAAWRARCAEFVGQLATYAELVGRVEGRHVAACWVHLPVGGGMVEVRR